MTTSTDRKVSVSRTIAATPETIFAIIDDPAQHAAMDGGTSVVDSRVGSKHLSLGDSFSMDMKMGVPYRMSSKVVEYERNRLIAWAHFGKHRWRYELEPVADGTRVTETFDWSTSMFPKAIEMMGYPKSHPTAMERTLENLDRLAVAAEAAS